MNGNSNAIPWLIRILQKQFVFWNSLKPLLPKKTPCGIGSAAGGRLLDYTKGVNIIDSIGDETRPVENDNIIGNDGIGGGVKFDRILTLIKWGVAIRGTFNKDSTGMITGAITQNSGRHTLMITTNPAYKDFSKDIYRFTAATITNDANDDFIFVSDGTNITLWQKGINVGTVTPAAGTILEVAFFNMVYSLGSTSLPSKGDMYDYRIYDLTTRTPQEINDYFNEHACKWTIDNMPDDDNFKYHHWAMQERKALRYGIVVQ